MTFAGSLVQATFGFGFAILAAPLFLVVMESTGAIPVLTLCGPRGIRTPDLLNAIETRSQLRYGPGFQ